MPQDRAIAYIDGFNLYYGIRSSGWKHLYWFDPDALAESIVGPQTDLIAVKYFTARVKGDSEKKDRQSKYLDAIRAQGPVEIVFGRYYPMWRRCMACGERWKSYEEKMTDSAIAANLVADAFLDRFDTAIMVGGDTDIVPAIRMVRTHLPGKTILAWFPPKRKNEAVGSICDGDATINQAHLSSALMPDKVCVAEDIEIERPQEWERAPRGSTSE